MGLLRLYLVDGSQLFRDGLRRLLEAQGCQVAGEAPSLEAAAATLDPAEPVDLVVFDVRPDGDCGGAVERVRLAWPTAKLVVLSSDVGRKSLMRAIGWGVDAYLSKDMTAQALARSFDLVMLGQQIFPTRLMIEMQEQQPAIGSDIRARTGLSPRELEILRALVEGKSNKAIARELNITEATVKVHLKALLRKVRVNNRTQAAVWALNQGFERIA
jgi:two-component system, NarL family, nitrate/nitrite response regulator NarL